MKLYSCFFAVVVMFFYSCQNTVSKEAKTDNSSTTLSPQEKKIKRENDIKEAVNNQEMIVGLWELVAVDSAEIKMEKERLSEIPFFKVEFSKDLKITNFSRNGTSVQKSYEWMAQNREIVITTESGSGHVLIKKVNENELITKEGVFRSFFKRIK